MLPLCAAFTWSARIRHSLVQPQSLCVVGGARYLRVRVCTFTILKAIGDPLIGPALEMFGHVTFGHELLIVGSLA